MDEVVKVVDPAEVGGGLNGRHVLEGEGGQELQHILVPLLHLFVYGACRRGGGIVRSRCKVL